MAITLRSYAKVNLGLAIGPIREDGFHTLLTLYQTLAVHDLVTVSARRLPASASRSRISLTSDHLRVPCDARNTAWRMTTAVLDHLGITAEVQIHIEKRLPIQGGMGAGSANAAATLIALERELQVAIPQPDRLKIAAQIGSDVPLFLIGGTVLGSGRGEVVEPVDDLPPTPCVVALPEVGISTPRAFRDWDTLQQTRLTYSGKSDNLEKLRRSYDLLRGAEVADNGLSKLLQAGLENDFEEVAFSQQPSLQAVKSQLSCSEDSVLFSSLSGSGSAVFGLYRSQNGAKAAQHRLNASCTRNLLTETLPREEYWGKMVAEMPQRT